MIYPNIPKASIGWRMGYGEYYREKYYSWKNILNKEEIKIYNNLFPVPICWSSDLLQHDNFWTYNWPKNDKSLEAIEQNNYSYIFFWGHQTKRKEINKTCLSQWYPSNFNVSIDHYSCAEQYMMSKKALLFGDNKTAQDIMATEKPNQMKILGRKIKNFDDKIWNQFKCSIVLTGNYYKFSQNETLRKYLINTYPKILVEASPYDKVWGIGMSENHKDIQNPSFWQGENLLGKCLMQVRNEIIRVFANYDKIEWNKINSYFHV